MAGIYNIVNQINIKYSPKIPFGVICMWYGAISNIPDGWALCDGTNGTPDLRDRFIVGAGGNYSEGNTGGQSVVALSIAQLPSHNHTSSLSLTSLTTNSAGGHTYEIYYETRRK